MGALLAAAICVFALAAFAACDDDDSDAADLPTAAATQASTGDAAAVEGVLRAMYDAWNAKDVNALLSHATDAGAVATFGEPGQPIDEVRADLAEFIGEPEVGTQGLTHTQVTGDAATTESAEVAGQVVENIRYSFIREGNSWKLDGKENLDTDIPDGTAAVPVTLTEFAFGVDMEEITAKEADGFAFAVRNDGTQMHELALAQVPEDFSIDDFFANEGEVPGFVFIAAAGPYAPRDGGNMVFTGPLEPGHYLMICFIPDTDGAPHAVKGMHAEFTIE
jgi:hypothetical protein